MRPFLSRLVRDPHVKICTKPICMSIDCSIIISTRNRSAMLKKTLEAFGKVVVPKDMVVEMIIVDNGSVDDTGDVVRMARHPHMEIRHLFEARPGKSRALNVAVAEAKGDVFLFTDDDVEPAIDWIERMARPLLQRCCDAVAGRIVLAEELERSWLTPMHLMWLAVDSEPKGESQILIGACMGLHRSVFDRIDHFDEELGPGASGFGEETLLWRQIQEANLRILSVVNTFVIHRPDPSRLLRSSWLSAAIRFGRTDAYCKYHWDHDEVMFPLVQSAIVQIKLYLRRLVQDNPGLDAEGCFPWEMSYLVKIESLKQFIIESHRPRNYERRGLRKKC